MLLLVSFLACGETEDESYGFHSGDFIGSFLSINQNCSGWRLTSSLSDDVPVKIDNVSSSGEKSDWRVSFGYTTQDSLRHQMLYEYECDVTSKTEDNWTFSCFSNHNSDTPDELSDWMIEGVGTIEGFEIEATASNKCFEIDFEIK